MESNNTSRGGIGFTGLLTILFVGLKLTGYITWSWFWVLSPIWISVSLVIGIIFIMLIISLIASLMVVKK